MQIILYLNTTITNFKIGKNVSLARERVNKILNHPYKIIPYLKTKWIEDVEVCVAFK